MLKRTVLGVLSLGLPMAAHAQVVNFHNAYNYANGLDKGPPLYGSVVYSGQGVYSDPGNNFWNGFGGGFSPTNNGFSPGDNNHTTSNGVTSTGASTPITITVHYDADNGGLVGTGNALQGTAGFLLSQASVATSGPGTFQLNSVPAGKYNLYLYGANNNNDRGAAFSMTTGGGTALNGITTTINANNGGNNANPSTVTFVLGQNYVEFLGVSPNASGNIAGQWGFVTNPSSGNSGEGDFNGLQLVNVTPVPEPATFGFGVAGFAMLLTRRKRR